MQAADVTLLPPEYDVDTQLGQALDRAMHAIEARPLGQLLQGGDDVPSDTLTPDALANFIRPAPTAFGHHLTTSDPFSSQQL